MKKRFTCLLNNKGLTLTELIVAMFLTSVILAIAVGMLAPVKNLMNTLKSNAHMDAISSTVNEYIRGTLQTATSLKFVTLEGDNTVKTADKDSVNGFFSGNRVNALAVLDTGTGEKNYRIFDFGEISVSQLDDLLKNKSEDDYAFFDPFYENSSCAVELHNDSGYLQVATQCYRNGEAINQKHVLNFKLLNGSLASVSGTGEEMVADASQTTIEGHGYLILYTLRDWS